MTAAATATPTQDSPTRRNGGMFRSLRVRNYRLYASGQIVSLTGTWMQRVAQDWLVLQLTNSGHHAERGTGVGDRKSVV